MINNLAGASFTTIGSNGGFNYLNAADNSAVAFNNSCSLTCSAGGGGSAAIEMPFNNSGSVDVQQGTLNLGGGPATSSGSFTAAAHTVLALLGENLRQAQ
jgi:hypothetical protein